MTATKFTGALPARGMDRNQFNAASDNYFTQLPQVVEHLNSLSESFGLNDLISASTTSLTISIGSKTLTVEPSKSYVAGQSITIGSNADGQNFMRGVVQSYNVSTGALTVFVGKIGGAGTFADWAVSFGVPQDLRYGDHVLVHTITAVGDSQVDIEFDASQFRQYKIVSRDLKSSAGGNGSTCSALIKVGGVWLTSGYSYARVGSTGFADKSSMLDMFNISNNTSNSVTELDISFLSRWDEGLSKVFSFAFRIQFGGSVSLAIPSEQLVYNGSNTNTGNIEGIRLASTYAFSGTFDVYGVV